LNSNVIWILQDVHDRVPNTTQVSPSIILSLLFTELNEDKMILGGSIRVIFSSADCEVDNHVILLQHYNFFLRKIFLGYQFLFLKFETVPRQILLKKKLQI